jgi:hypothetical protein
LRGLRFCLDGCNLKQRRKPIEFEKGKAGIVVGSKEKLPAVIDTLIAAVHAGELDNIFSQAAKTGTIAKPERLLDHRSNWASHLAQLTLR